jgi:hypothetical protein
MTGSALRAGVEIVKRLGLDEQYGYRIHEDWIGEGDCEDAGRESGPGMAAAPGACFIR